MPSMPRARNAMVGFVCWSTRSAIISASPDSEVPHVFRERDTITARSPARSRRSGSTCCVTMSVISYGTPGTAYTTFLVPVPRSTSQRSPGAVPIGFGITSPPSGTSAWRKLFSGNGRPRPPKMARMCSTRSSWRSSPTPITSAIASRVTSSGVGPSPPHTITASARSSSSRTHRTMRSRLSPTLRCSHVSMPTAASCSPIQELFVSTIWPSRSSVPIARTSHRMLTRALPPGLAIAADHDVEGRDHRQHHREPQQDVMERRPLVGGRQEHDAHRDELEDRFPLPEPAGGQRDPPLRRERPVHRDADLAHGHDDHRGPREVSVDPEGEEAAQHEELVGERVEEGAGARRAVAARQPAVEPVGGGQDEPQGEG